ncbi:hypothetical protein Hanom_Chr12g01099171 [Helianthus anomalus]
MSFSSLRFGQFCDFRPKVCFSASGSKRFGQLMELTSWMKMARFQTFLIQMRKNKTSDESRKTGQTSETKMAFYSKRKL